MKVLNVYLQVVSDELKNSSEMSCSTWNNSFFSVGKTEMETKGEDLLVFPGNSLEQGEKVKMKIPSGIFTGEVNWVDLSQGAFILRGTWEGKCGGLTGGLHNLFNFSWVNTQLAKIIGSQWLPSNKKFFTQEEYLAAGTLRDQIKERILGVDPREEKNKEVQQLADEETKKILFHQEEAVKKIINKLKKERREKKYRGFTSPIQGALMEAGLV